MTKCSYADEEKSQLDSAKCENVSDTNRSGVGNVAVGISRVYCPGRG